MTEVKATKVGAAALRAVMHPAWSLSLPQAHPLQLAIPSTSSMHVLLGWCFSCDLELCCSTMAGLTWWNRHAAAAHPAWQAVHVQSAHVQHVSGALQHWESIPTV